MVLDVLTRSTVTLVTALVVLLELFVKSVSVTILSNRYNGFCQIHCMSYPLLFSASEYHCIIVNILTQLIEILHMQCVFRHQ